MTILVIAEHDHQTLKSSTLNAIAAGKLLNSDMDVAVLSHKGDVVASLLTKIEGVKKVIQMDHAALTHDLAERSTEALLTIAKNYDYIIFPATTFGKNIAPRLAALLDVGQISDVLKIIAPDTFERPIYAGNAIQTVQSKDAIKVLTVRTTAFAPVSSTGGSAVVEKVTPTLSNSPAAEFVDLLETKSSRPELTSARIVVSGGRGLQSKENFHIIEELADTLNAAIGASRAAVDAGYISNDHQVGQTGKIVAPDLYIAIGISGAIQHLAGMKESKTIVAINKDEEAPIFQVADFGLVGDLFQIIPAFNEAVAALKAKKS
ncbi:MAG: electron transfer flavoprotein subunit alpha/FixB family protein [Candidatus Nucleicultricaceae bacterium]